MNEKVPPKTEVFKPKPKATKKAEPIGGALSSFIITATELSEMSIPPRQFIVEPFLPTDSMTMVFAERGLGKTWFALFLALAVCEGRKFLDRYDVPTARTVLYIDGEMTLGALQERINRMTGAPPSTFMLLPSERLHREDRPLNINSEEDQQRILDALDHLAQAGRRPDLIVVDNLSSLSGGVDENDNSALDALLQWLIRLRHMGYAILLVHHAGKSGAQRGASRREDLLDTSIALRKPETGADVHDGAHFILDFVKTRGKMPRPPSLELWLRDGADGKLGWLTRVADKAASATTVLRKLGERRFEKQSDLAKDLGLSEGRISQLLKKLRQEGLVEDRSLGLTRAGRERAIELFPDLANRLMEQGDLLKDDGAL